MKNIFLVNLSTYADVDTSSDPYTGCLYVSGEHAPEMYVSGEHEKGRNAVGSNPPSLL